MGLYLRWSLVDYVYAIGTHIQQYRLIYLMNVSLRIFNKVDIDRKAAIVHNGITTQMHARHILGSVVVLWETF